MKLLTTSTGKGVFLPALAATTVITVVLISAAAIDAQGQSQQAVGDSGDFLTEVTVLEIMESMMAPSAEALWNSVAYISTAEGTIDAKPETNEDWQQLRWRAVTLAEAANALMVPGRFVDTPGTLSDDPDHELGPDEIQELINGNRPTWIAYAHAMHATAMETIRVIDAKNVDDLLNIGGAIDTACESCHLQFWYPE